MLFGMNKKGGIDDDKFVKFMLNSIVPLYPNAKDKPGRCIIIKMDSDPWRTNLKLLSKLRMRGFILYPCVPNTTHVKQKKDQCYGPFKTQLLINLNLIVLESTRKKACHFSQSLLACPCSEELIAGINMQWK